ncbi:MAG: helix-turn-helix domain-containing protein [Calditrichales bacterium]|nr:helix-turn-helix domain-containing protein [Calditrichales bacterium]
MMLLRFYMIFKDDYFLKNVILVLLFFSIFFFLPNAYALKTSPQFEKAQDSAGYYLLEAELNYEKGQYNKSLLLYQNVLNLSETAKDTNLIIESLSALSNLYNELGFADSAFIYCEREMILNKAIQNYAAVSDNFRKLYTFPRYTVGGISESQFITIGYLDSGLVYAKKSKSLSAIVHSMTNYAVRTYVDDSEKGLRLIQAAIDSARKLPYPNEPLVYALQQSYHIYWKAGKRQEAEDNLLEALPMALIFNKPARLAQIYWLLGMIENSRANNKKALSFLRKAVYYCEKGNISPLKRSIYSSIREVYRELGNTDSTLYFMEKYSRLAEKAHNNTMNKQISLLSARFKVAEKEGTIELLDELNRQKEEKIYLQNLFILTLAASVIIVSILLIFSYFQYKKTQKAYLILTRKTTEIQKQQKEIVRLNGEKRANIKSKLEPQKMKLVDLFEKDKIYLDKYLNLQTVASQLDTNTSYLSTLINSSYKCNFTQFLHKYRVLEACEILSKEENEIYSMEGIAEMSGFVSKSAFNKAFKEFTGLTPTTFRKNIRAEKT